MPPSFGVTCTEVTSRRVELDQRSLRQQAFASRCRSPNRGRLRAAFSNRGPAGWRALARFELVRVSPLNYDTLWRMWDASTARDAMRRLCAVPAVRDGIVRVCSAVSSVNRGLAESGRRLLSARGARRGAASPLQLVLVDP